MGLLYAQSGDCQSLFCALTLQCSLERWAGEGVGVAGLGCKQLRQLQIMHLGGFEQRESVSVARTVICSS